MKKVSIDDNGVGPTFTIDADLPPEQEHAVVAFLWANKDVFSWKASDLTGVPRGVIEHHFVVCPNARPIKQKTWCQALEKQAHRTRGAQAVGSWGHSRGASS